MAEFGALCLIPTVVVLAVAIMTHRPVFALFTGVVTGLLILSPGDIIPPLTDVALTVMMDDTIGWIILVCGLMGSLIFLLVKTGAAQSFAQSLAEKADSRRKSLLFTWLLGLIIFIDDYLNAIAVSSAMKKVTDRYKVSRPMLAYVVDSTAAPMCVIIPISTWAVFFAGVLEDTGTAAEGEGLAMYISGIPYMFYAWLAVLIVPLVSMGWIPALGPMKKAELATEQGTAELAEVAEFTEAEQAAKNHDKANIWLFLIPMIALIGFTLWYEIDLLRGVVACLAVTVVYFVATKHLSFSEALDGVLKGFKLMLGVFAIIVVAFMFKSVNDELGLPQFVISSLQPYMNATLLPLLTFLSMAVVAFATGSSWGVFAIAIPIVMPLGQSFGVDPALMIGALLSASSFGSHACFYSDATVLVSQSSGCTVMEHALTQFPYALIGAILASGLFIFAAAI